MKVRASRLPPKRVAWSVAKSRVGNLAVGVTGEAEICRVAFLRGHKIEETLAKWREAWPRTEFYRGAKLDELCDYSILLVGTLFQCAVWREMAKIPLGYTRTYGDIARRIGSAKGSRAVGHACGANPVPFLVPCHRVVGANGLGGFSGGLEIKKALLEIEAARVDV